MADNKQAQGKVFQVGVAGQRLTCQMESSISFSQDFESEEQCKDDFLTPNEESVVWSSKSPGEKSWEITGSGKVEDSFTSTAALALDKHFIESDEPIEVTFGTVDPSLANTIVYSGSAFISAWSLTAPTTGTATYEFTLTGQGKVNRVVTPKG